jgi:methionine-rich copper-binding protein CopC
MHRTRIIGSMTALALVAGVAGAHAFLDDAEPRVGSTVRVAPREITLRFTQAIEPAFSSIIVTDAFGQRVDAGAPVISSNVMRVPLRPIAAGSYHVTWRVLSVDTHVTEGAFTFAVDDAVSANRQ